MKLFRWIMVLIFSMLPLFSSSITPDEYQKMLGHGMDVDWSKNDQGRAAYQTKTVSDFKEAGIQHVRIRVRDDVDDTLLEAQVDDCLRLGVIPIIAYQADSFKVNPSEAELAHVVSWWRHIAELFQDKSPLLSFDLLIECSDQLNKRQDMLDKMFEACVSAIRETNPERILFISPRVRSDPSNLASLAIPSKGNGFLMAQWHFYAAGPSKSGKTKRWTTGTKEEQKMITDAIGEALSWQQKHGIPTWVGAWMPGNYNDGDDYTLEEQIQFSTFMTSALDKAGIPFAVNSDTKFYDRDKGCWISAMAPLRSVLFH